MAGEFTCMANVASDCPCEAAGGNEGGAGEGEKAEDKKADGAEEDEEWTEGEAEKCDNLADSKAARTGGVVGDGAWPEVESWGNVWPDLWSSTDGLWPKPGDLVEKLWSEDGGLAAVPEP